MSGTHLAPYLNRVIHFGALNPILVILTWPLYSPWVGAELTSLVCLLFFLPSQVHHQSIDLVNRERDHQLVDQ
jgi:hypothetical protein